MNRLGLIATIAFIVSACGKLPVEGNAQQIVTKTIVDSSYIVKADSLEQVIAKLDSIIINKNDTINNINIRMILLLRNYLFLNIN